jgi:hypothetical protein
MWLRNIEAWSALPTESPSVLATENGGLNKVGRQDFPKFPSQERISVWIRTPFPTVYNSDRSI